MAGNGTLSPRIPPSFARVGTGVSISVSAPHPRNFDDREAHWDFIEYASEDSETWHGNTTQVDAFCIPITIEMGDKKVGITESRRALFENFRTDAPEPFKSCVKGEAWIVSPCRATFGADGPNAHYFDAYIDAVWTMYAQEEKTPSGKWSGKVVDGALTFTPVDGKGKPLTCASKPTTQDAFMGTGVLATNPQFCAAINRHVLADPADWRKADAFYKSEPCNWYAKFFQERSLGKKAYGFCYGDVAEQAAFLGQGARAGLGRHSELPIFHATCAAARIPASRRAGPGRQPRRRAQAPPPLRR